MLLPWSYFQSNSISRRIKRRETLTLLIQVLFACKQCKTERAIWANNYAVLKKNKTAQNIDDWD
jgi:hypothetical protein